MDSLHEATLWACSTIQWPVVSDLFPVFFDACESGIGIASSRFVAFFPVKTPGIVYINYLELFAGVLALNLCERFNISNIALLGDSAVALS